MNLTDRIEYMKTFIPKTGANLLGVDSHALPGEELYLIDHFETLEAAERARQARLKENPSEQLHVYPAS